MNLFSKYKTYKKEVLNAGMWLSQHGYFGSLRGSGGNVSARIDDTTMAITPSGVKYQELSLNDICIIGFDNKEIAVKKGRKPSIESGMHSVIYQKRPEINAIVHTHQTYGSVFAILNLPIPALFDEVSWALGKIIQVVPYALSGSRELAANVGAKLSNNANAYIIQNHGILALGKTMNQALLHAELLEKAAQIYYLALSTGKPVTELPIS
ncbi:MAG TPA: class II aldolase/adducin family protein [Smithellaceae bacterium]|nr:class II aldolase/adducin family protein [Smithellaceae bacterium]HRS88981.1 class II aldolase/adducin family protein [Smithellaceae bacterium]HRV25597.1 class II aldolase/adducin family protein [Smithellaceae bacterium]